MRSKLFRTKHDRRTSMLENKNSEAGFREQFELYQLRLKEEEERK